MDPKDLRTEANLNECIGNKNGNYSQNGAQLADKNKTYLDIGSNTVGKVGAQAVRPCAVIGPDRVVPPPYDTPDVKKPALEPWQFPEHAYRPPPQYPQKIANYEHPSRNISPRQTFQENMQRIMVPPGYDTLKVNGDHNVVPQNCHITKSTKISETKYCDVPYSINTTNNDQKNRKSEMPVNAQYLRPQPWLQGGIHGRPQHPYNAADPYQYADYANSAGSRLMPVIRQHHPGLEDGVPIYADHYYRPGNIRYEPYPTVKDRYPPARFEYVGNYTNPYQSPHFPPHKYDFQKLPVHPYVHPQVSHLREPYIEGYQRHPKTQMNVSYHVQGLPKYSSPPGNMLPNKLYPYPTEQNSLGSIKSPYDNANKYYVTPPKPYPSESCYMHDFAKTNAMKPQMMIPYPNNYPVNMHPYYRKDPMHAKNIDFPHYKSADPTYSRIHSQFSPNLISPSGTNASSEAIHAFNISVDGCGNISQSPANPRSNNESGLYRAYDNRYSQVNRTSISKPQAVPKNSNSSEKKNIDLRQFLSSWNEGDDENSEMKEVIVQKSDNLSKQYEVVSNQEQLVVLGLVNVPSDELDKYEHIQKVTKLPDNIKGYSSIELLNQFEEVIGSSNTSFTPKEPVRETDNLLTKAQIKAVMNFPSRPISPLDVEAKISQSIIHKDVGCNFDIRPCSPHMLNVQQAAPVKTLLEERVIEKVSNHVRESPISNHTVDENLNHIAKYTNRSMPLNSDDQSSVSSCKMLKTLYSQQIPAKQNYLQELESNSGICLASLPRLDNDIELNFPEVNQQFINANKSSPESAPSYVGLPTLDSASANAISKNGQESYDSDYLHSPKGSTKLSKYRKNMKYGNQEIDTLNQCMVPPVRIDSVIIKNPDTNDKSDKKADIPPETTPSSNEIKSYFMPNSNDTNTTTENTAMNLCLNSESDNLFCLNSVVNEFSKSQTISQPESKWANERDGSKETPDVMTKTKSFEEELFAGSNDGDMSSEIDLLNVSDPDVLDISFQSKESKEWDNETELNFPINVHDEKPLNCSSEEKVKLLEGELFSESNHGEMSSEIDLLNVSDEAVESNETIAAFIEETNHLKHNTDIVEAVERHCKDFDIECTKEALFDESSQGPIVKNLSNREIQGILEDPTVTNIISNNDSIDIGNCDNNSEDGKKRLSQTHHIESNTEEESLNVSKEISFAEDLQTSDQQSPENKPVNNYAKDNIGLEFKTLKITCNEELPHTLVNSKKYDISKPVLHKKELFSYKFQYLTLCREGPVNESLGYLCKPEDFKNVNINNSDSYISEVSHSSEEMDVSTIKDMDIKKDNGDVKLREICNHYETADLENTNHSIEESGSETTLRQVKNETVPETSELIKDNDTNKSSILETHEEISNTLENVDIQSGKIIKRDTENCRTESQQSSENSPETNVDPSGHTEYIENELEERKENNNDLLECESNDSNKSKVNVKTEFCDTDTCMVKYSCSNYSNLTNCEENSISGLKQNIESSSACSCDDDTLLTKTDEKSNRCLVNDGKNHQSSNQPGIRTDDQIQAKNTGVHSSYDEFKHHCEEKYSCFKECNSTTTNFTDKNKASISNENLKEEIEDKVLKPINLENKGHFSDQSEVNDEIAVPNRCEENNLTDSEDNLNSQQSENNFDCFEEKIEDSEKSLNNPYSPEHCKETNTKSEVRSQDIYEICQNQKDVLETLEDCSRSETPQPNDEINDHKENGQENSGLFPSTFCKNEENGSSIETELIVKASIDIEENQTNETSLVNANVVLDTLSNNSRDSVSNENVFTEASKHCKRRLKRSLSDSALDKRNVDYDHPRKQYQQWPCKRRRLDNHLDGETDFSLNTDNVCNIIPIHRRNSIADVYDGNVSFCILIDEDNCLVTQEELYEESVYSVEQLDHVDGIEHEGETFTDYSVVEEGYYVADQPFSEYDNNNAVEETWVEDIACVETVVCSDTEEEIDCSSALISNEDYSIRDTSNLKKSNNVVKKSFDEENNAESINTVSDFVNIEDQCTSENYNDCKEIDGNQGKISFGHTVVEIDNSVKDDDKNELQEESHTEILPENNLLNGAEEIQKYKTDDDSVISNKCSTITSTFNRSSASPEVSSTTTEDRKTGILLKITNHNGSITSHINGIDFTQNKRIRCKFNEHNNYMQTENTSPARPLITKAAQKYIPPLRETITDLKVKIRLPPHNLEKLKLLKESKDTPKKVMCDLKNNVIAKNKNNIPKKIFPKKPKPNFEDVLKSIDQMQVCKLKQKSKKSKCTVPKVIIKKNVNGSHYTSCDKNDAYNPDLTGRKWQPWVFLEKHRFIDKMAAKGQTKAVFCHRKNTYIPAEKFYKYRAVNTKFVISQNRSHSSPSGPLKYTIKLKRT